MTLVTSLFPARLRSYEIPDEQVIPNVISTTEGLRTKVRVAQSRQLADTAPASAPPIGLEAGGTTHALPALPFAAGRPRWPRAGGDIVDGGASKGWRRGRLGREQDP